MRDFFIVTLDGVVVRSGVVPAGMAVSQPIAEGEVLQIVTPAEYRASQERTQR